MSNRVTHSADVKEATIHRNQSCESLKFHGLPWKSVEWPIVELQFLAFLHWLFLGLKIAA